MGGPLNEHLTGFGRAGMRDKVTQESVEVRTDLSHFKLKGIVIASDTDDPRATGTGKLQPGLVLVRVEAGGGKQGKYVEFSNAGSPGATFIEKAVILLDHVNLAKPSDPTVFEDKGVAGLLHGFVDNALLEFDTVVVGEIAELKAALKLVEFEDLP